MELRVRGRGRGRQNIEPQGLRGKILRDKELAAGAGRLAVAAVECARTFPIWHSPISQSRLLVTGKGFLFVEGCGKVLVQAVAGPTLRNREGLAGLELRAKLVRC